MAARDPRLLAGLDPDGRQARIRILAVEMPAAAETFGVYEGEAQVGFARVVTDRATFAFVSDDFVVESHRGRGLAKWLMDCILAHPDLQGLRRILLVTHDPRLYLKAGFGALKEPETYMEIRNPAPYAEPAAPPSSR